MDMKTMVTERELCIGSGSSEEVEDSVPEVGVPPLLPRSNLGITFV